MASAAAAAASADADDLSLTTTHVFTPMYADEQADEEEYPAAPVDRLTSFERAGDAAEETGRVIHELQSEEMEDEQLIDDEEEDEAQQQQREATASTAAASHARTGVASSASSAPPLTAQGYIPHKLVGHTYGPDHSWQLRPSPNPLLDGQLYQRLRTNGIFEVRPAIVKFEGFKLGERYTQKVEIVNVSGRAQRVHILVPPTPPRTAGAAAEGPSPFRCSFSKLGRVAPGMSETLTITFEPRAYRFYEDLIRLHCLGENLLLPLQAYPVLNIRRLTLPAQVDMGAVAVGMRVSKRLELHCDIPVQFEFELTVLNAQEEFTIFPTKGIVPAEGATHITVDYSPKRAITSTLDVLVNISQFGFQPFVMNVVGHSHVMQWERPIEEGAGSRKVKSERQKRLAAASHLTALMQHSPKPRRAADSAAGSFRATPMSPLSPMSAASAASSARPKSTLQRLH